MSARVSDEQADRIARDMCLVEDDDVCACVLAKDLVDARAEIAALKAERDAAKLRGWKAGMLEAAGIADHYAKTHHDLAANASSTYQLFYEEEAGDFEEFAAVIRAAAERGPTP